MGLVSEPRRFDVFLVNLDPTLGSEIRKTRPAAVVSPDDMNRHLRTVVVAPMTTARRPWPTRVAVDFAGKQGDVALDQIRTIDKVRLGRCLGRLADAEAGQILDVLRRMFA
jgi:mRNA interferase MazF